MTERISSVLNVIDGNIRCGNCDFEFGSADGDWKAKTIIRDQPMNNAGGVAYHSGDHVLLRTFVCPGCARLLATETAMENEPHLKNSLA
tara:strand:+ start:6143 stop:6409 length:267 start_codon:yes stop_codon:yes gene_type:complete